MEMCFFPAVELLLKAQANVNAVAQDGITPLCLAVSSSEVPTIMLLLDNGADVTVSLQTTGETPLRILLFGW